MANERKIAVSLEHRFYLYKGKLYTKLSFPYDYWKDYLKYFSEVKIIARAAAVSSLEPGMVRVDGERVSFFALPYYVGPWQFMIKLPVLIRFICKVAKNNNFFLLRSGNISNLLWFFLLLIRKPYIREYPGNIREGITGFAGNGVFIRLIALFLEFIARLQGRYSKANSFVSEYCRELYGSHRPGFVFSSFRESEVSVHKADYSVGDFFDVVCVGRLEGEKGHVFLLDAVRQSAFSKKINIHVIGDGGKIKELRDYADFYGLAVNFYGAITNRRELFYRVCAADLFVIPSLTEGMPRALLEAMAIGMPCIGTNVGGIPEVLPANCMCTPADASALSALIDKFILSEEFRENMGQRNRDFVSRKYSDNALMNKKIEFWSKLYG